ncbi:MAG: Holliday junction branch migration DNA helicase RuvB [Pirellulaceae bacterium]|jgi:Holliday junction DNA helicase RuvB|nr:Holliday junction branch migration DNA helicase RuvB [Planctomycetaceae bacterium]
MVKETVLQPTSGGDDEHNVSLRPKTLAEVIGQQDVVDRLRIAIAAAQKRGEPLGHILLDGPPGLGKTTLATCIPAEMRSDLQLTSGPLLKKPSDLVPYLTNAGENSTLFIDEIHRLAKPAEEYLYSAMEDFRLDILIGEGIGARTVNMPLKPFTLIGATTRAGLLSGPLRDRFQIREHVDFYELSEMTRIVHRSAQKLSVEIDDPAAELIASRSRGTPRVANNRLRWVRDFASSKADGRISVEVAEAALKMYGIDQAGLGPMDRKYLTTLVNVFNGGPAGIEAIGHTMNISSDTLEDDVEPFLLRSGWVVRSPRGRVLTDRAYQHLGIPHDQFDGFGQPRLF